MFENFNDIPWHDAELEEIIIDRVRNDHLSIKICLPEDYGGSKITIEFVECYHMNLDMNFGILPPDTILNAQLFEETQKLTEIRHKWKRMGVDLSKLNCYKINTNSTNSIIEVYACSFRVIDNNL